jgi:predicted  nucleic acid-binding Zn-ribbon protein
VAVDDLLRTLTRFHREVVVPDIERIVDVRIAPLRDEMLANFDAVFKRLDRLESEYQALTAALRRVEERMVAIEQRMTGVEQRMTALEEKVEKLALRSELVELKERVHVLEHRIAELEAQL